MAAQIARSEPLIFRPDYRFFTLRDADADADDGYGPALDQANAAVAGSSGHAVYVVVAQDLIPVHLSVELWDDTPPADADWQATPTLPLTCETGLLVFGDVTGTASTIQAPGGTGGYAVRVLYTGREQALVTLGSLDEATATLNGSQSLDLYDEHGGIERYRLQAWRTG